MSENRDYENKELAYDLRATYAKIVGEHLLDISLARKKKSYAEWFNALEDLYTIVKFKFKKQKDKKEVKYNKLRKDFITLANNKHAAYSSGSGSSEDNGEIEAFLRKIERHLLYKMDQAKMFGSKRDMEGLM